VASSTVADNVERVGEVCLRTAGDGWRRRRHWHGLRMRKSLLSNALKTQEPAHHEGNLHKSTP
jgi:hypothetical protein